MAEIRSKAQQYAQRFEAWGKRLEVICVDHLGLVKASSAYRGNKVAETEEVSGDLKRLAKEMDCAVIALAQLSRQVEGREDKRPTLSDLRWSGAIEQDADVIMFPYRPEYYLRRTEEDADKEMKRQEKLAKVQNRLELLIEKHRGGSTGQVDLFCDMGCAVVSDLERGDG
jgi:replicative DNA helicase